MQFSYYVREQWEEKNIPNIKDKTSAPEKSKF